MVTPTTQADFEAEFKCCVCQQIPNVTSINPDCMHRMCKACFEDALRRHNTECPLCRIKIPTRRTLRQDPSYDLLLKMGQDYVNLLSTLHVESKGKAKSIF